MRSAILHRLRVDDWWLFHLLPLLSAAYASIAVFAVPAGVAYPVLGRLIASIVAIAAYSHIFNDIGDVELDAAAGKPDRWGSVPVWARGAIGGALAAGGFAVWIGAGLGAGTWALLGAIVILQPMYALRPLRLKERGAWGLVTDSLHTHALPMLFCAVLFADVAGASARHPFPWILAAWSFLVGLRGIVYHQRIDEANDRRAGVATFVTAGGSARAGMLARRFIFPAELAALAALGLAVFAAAPLLVAGFVAYAALMLLADGAGVWNAGFADPAPAVRGAHIPLLGFYRSWPAPAFALLLAVGDPRFIPLLAVHSLLFAKPIARQGIDMARIVHALVTTRVAGVRRAG
ncbi:MAG TPA: UbiA family prenyltransferase [Longimicrobium sp.]|jgi:hypothetical protein